MTGLQVWGRTGKTFQGSDNRFLPPESVLAGSVSSTRLWKASEGSRNLHHRPTPRQLTLSQWLVSLVRVSRQPGDHMAAKASEPTI